MKTTLQVSKVSKPSNLDLFKAFGYALTAFVISVGGVLTIVILANGCEAVANLFK